MQDPANQTRQPVPVKLVLPRWLVKGLIAFFALCFVIVAALFVYSIYINKQAKGIYPVVLELLIGETTLATLARRYEVSSHLLIQWRQAYQSGRLDDQPPPRDLHALEARNRELERLVGRQAVEIEFLKKAASFQRQHSSGSGLIATGVASPSKRGAR